MTEEEEHVIELSTSTLRRRGPTLLLTVKPDAAFGLAEAREAIDAMRRLADSPLPLLVDARGYSTATMNVRPYLSTDAVRGAVSAIAVVIDSPVMRVVSTLFLGLASPPFPFKVFTSVELATAWVATDVGR